MSDDWKTIDASMMFSGMTINRNIPGINSNKTNQNSSFDPCDMMIKKRKKQKEAEESLEFTPPDVVQYDRDDIKALESFCKQYNIVGFNSGRFPPKEALRMLKNKLGVVDRVIENKKILLD